MKVKFFTLIFLLLFSRGCDFYSTSLWFFDNPDGETNPLASILGFGWTGLILSNVIILGLIIYAFYYFSFKYKVKKIEPIPDKLTDYVSLLYFKEKGKFYKIFFQLPNDKKIIVAHYGYVLIRVVIVASFVATCHNLCQYYQLPFYDTFRNIVKRPLFVIYGLIILTFLYFQFTLFKSEYKSLIAIREK